MNVGGQQRSGNLESRNIKCQVVSVLNQVPRPEDVWRSGNIAPRILNLGTRWKCQLHAPAVLPPGWKGAVPIGKVVGWARKADWTRGQRENSLLRPYRESNPGRPGCSRHYTDWATPAPKVTHKKRKKIGRERKQVPCSFMKYTLEQVTVIPRQEHENENN
jgi:hypothetical protein